MKRLAIASHPALIDGKEYDGIGNAVVEALSTEQMTYYFVRHSMDGNAPSRIDTYQDGKVTSSTRLPVVSRPSPLRYVSEMFATVWHFSFRKKVDTFVAIDPLNACAAVFLKKLGRIDTCIFLTPDYSPQRFGNKQLNNIYHGIDRFCVRNADEVWSVSTRIQEVRRKMGLPDNKNILLPNVPPAKFTSLRKNKHDTYNLITTGIVDKQLDFEGTIRAVAQLRDTYPKLSFTIVGNGPEESRLQLLAEELQIADRIHFMGRQPLTEALQLQSKAGIGLALYTGEWAFNHFGDSTKCREFFFFGLPVISTDSHATVPEIKQFKPGLVVEKGVEQYVKAITDIIENYDAYAKASSKLGEAYNDVHRKNILRVLQPTK